MKVILKSDITGLGEEGAIVEVSPGYARNFLFPSKKAIQHNVQNISVLKSRMKSIEQRRSEQRKMHASVKERLEAESLTIAMTTGEKGHLYGAVTAHMVSDLLKEKGIDIPKSHIILPDGHSIKNIGVYAITVKLYHGVQAQCSVVVTDEHGNSSSQEPLAQKAEAVVENADTAEVAVEAQTPADAPDAEPNTDTAEVKAVTVENAAAGVEEGTDE